MIILYYIFTNNFLYSFNLNFSFVSIFKIAFALLKKNQDFILEFVSLKEKIIINK